MMTWIWVLIPLAAILVGAFKEWLKFQEKQQQIGDSTRLLENAAAGLKDQLAEMEARAASLDRRVRNLEAIVTGEVWDTLHDDALAPAEKEKRLARARLDLYDPDEETDARKLEQLARRLRE